MSRQPKRITRRDAVRWSAGSLLALGLWPGALRAADKTGSSSFRFLVINDTHYGRVEDAQMGICHMLCYAFMENPQLGKVGPEQLTPY